MGSTFRIYLLVVAPGETEENATIIEEQSP